MSYSATIEVVGTRRSDEKDVIFEQEITVFGDSVGEVLDDMVEKAYELYYELSLLLITDFPKDYVLDNDYWYISCSWPTTNNPYSTERGRGAGSHLVSPAAIISSAVHYRHMEVHGFINGEVNYLRNKAYATYVEGVTPIREFNLIFSSPHIEEFRHFGFTGEQFDRVFKAMGKAQIPFLKDYASYKSATARGAVEHIVIPTLIEAPAKKKRGIFDVLFGRDPH